MTSWLIHHGDVLSVLPTLPEASVHCCVTSPPYWGLRDYGVDGQLGLEPTPQAYIARMVEVFREVRRVLREDGTLWLNLGDSYAGSWGAQGRQGETGEMASRSVVSARQIEAAPKRKSGTGSIVALEGIKAKDLCGIPWMLALALRADGWYLRQDIIWHKPNPMPESVRDRCTKAHEYIFLLSKNERYYYDAEAVSEKAVGTFTESTGDLSYSDGANRRDNTPSSALRVHRDTRNRRSVWTVTTKPYKGAHFATFPPKLIEPCILAGCPVGGTVLDPFTGSGTTGAVALEHGRKFVGVELNAAYIQLAQARIAKVQPRLLT